MFYYDKYLLRCLGILRHITVLNVSQKCDCVLDIFFKDNYDDFKIRDVYKTQKSLQKMK